MLHCLHLKQSAFCMMMVDAHCYHQCFEHKCKILQHIFHLLSVEELQAWQENITKKIKIKISRIKYLNYVTGCWMRWKIQHINSSRNNKIQQNLSLTSHSNFILVESTDVALISSTTSPESRLARASLKSKSVFISSWRV